MTLVNSFGGNSTTHKPALPESSANLQPTLARVQKLDSGFSLIRFLGDNPKTLVTAEGIALRLKRSLPAVYADLRTLEELGLVRRTEPAGIPFFGIDTDPAQRKLVRELLARQDLRRE
jgi:Fe2+ or Zn2+ uptake regulation protein